MTNPSKIAVLATHPIHYQIQLFKKLAAVPGIDVTLLFCSRFGLSRQTDHTFGKSVHWYHESILEGCKYKFLPNYSWERSPRSVFGTINPGVLREMLRERYDVLLVQGYAGITEWLAMVAGRRYVRRILFRAETTLRRDSQVRRSALRKFLMLTLPRFVDTFLPIGSRSHDFYIHHGISADRLMLSPYTIDNEFFFSEANRLVHRRREIRQRLGIPANAPVILYASKLIPRKRSLDLLKAFEQVQRPAILLFVGDGPQRQELEARANDSQLKNVVFVGFQNQETLPQFYAVGDVFVLPSEYEPWGLVVNEAMCFSLPIVTTHGVSSAVDLVRHGVNGFLYDAGDIPALSAALNRLLSGESLRLKMGQRSREIISKWDFNASVSGICNALRAE